MSGKLGKRSVGWWFFSVLCMLLLVSGVRKAQASFLGLPTLDREGISSFIAIDEVECSGHEFTPGSATRTYFFTVRGTERGYLHEEEVYKKAFSAKQKIVWNSQTKRLFVHTSASKWFQGDEIYQCDNLDPLLADDPTKWELVSSKKNWQDKNLSMPVYLWGFKSWMEGWRDSITSGQRFSLKIEALAKSMRMEVSSAQVEIPKSDVMLLLHTATDVVPPKGWTVTFRIEEQNAPIFFDLYGNVVDGDHEITLRRKTTFYTLKHLRGGEYTCWALMKTGLTGGKTASNQIIFKVVSKSYKPVILTPKEDAKIGKTKTVTVRITGPGVDAVSGGLEVYYSKLAAQFPYEKIAEIKKGHPFVPSGVWKCPCNLTGKLGLVPREGDYRLRAKTYYQGKPLGESDWRHFHVGKALVAVITRPFKIISPAEGKAYANTVPVEISLPDDMKGENPTLTLGWYWYPSARKSSGGGPNVQPWPQRLMRQTVSVSGKGMILTTYKGSMSVEKLFKKKAQVLKDASGSGQFMLTAVLRMEGQPPRNYSTIFDAGVLGAPAQKDNQGDKKDLSYHMKVPAMSVMPFKTLYRPREDIAIRLRGGLQGNRRFQVRFRPDPRGRYETLRAVPHRFVTLGSITTLHLKFRKPGQYQVRFTSGEGGHWEPWHGFEVMGSNLAATGKMKKVASPRPTIHLAPPAIVSPKNRQTFMMTGKEARVAVKIRHAAGYKVALAIQRREHGAFVTINPKLTQTAGKTETTFEVRLAKTGEYQIRAKLTGAPHSPWSAWRTFEVDKLNKNLIHKIKPQPHTGNKLAPAHQIRLKPSGVTLK